MKIMKNCNKNRNFPIKSKFLNSQCSNSIYFVRTFPSAVLYKIEKVSKFMLKIICTMKIKILFFAVFAFGQTFPDFEISPKYNETCDSPDNAKLCENQCVEDLQDCTNTCQDQPCIGSCQRNLFSCLEGNFNAILNIFY